MDDEIRLLQRNDNLTPDEKKAKIREVLLNRNKKNITKVKKEKCTHYDRNCNIIAKCCEKEYGCRLCHDEYEDHLINRFETETIICKICNTKQKISNECIKNECKTIFGEYFCEICRLWRNKIDIYHCVGCGICNKGKKEDFIHCNKCKSCFYGDHECIGDFISCKCGVCHQPIYQSILEYVIPKCKHPLHKSCEEIWLKNDYRCPLCKKSLRTMNWNKYENSLVDQPMPDEYKKIINIKCNDCDEKSENVDFHFLGSKCSSCGGYNTYDLS
jgi:RING finger/CHY zinc finger protein 1